MSVLKQVRSCEGYALLLNEVLQAHHPDDAELLHRSKHRRPGHGWLRSYPDQTFPTDHNHHPSWFCEEVTSLVNQLLLYLPLRRKRAIQFRFGLLGSGVLTLQEVGEKVGVSSESIRQMVARVCRQLRWRSNKSKIEQLLARVKETSDS